MHDVIIFTKVPLAAPAPVASFWVRMVTYSCIYLERRMTWHGCLEARPSCHTKQLLRSTWRQLTAFDAITTFVGHFFEQCFAIHTKDKMNIKMGMAFFFEVGWNWLPVNDLLRHGRRGKLEYPLQHSQFRTWIVQSITDNVNTSIHWGVPTVPPNSNSQNEATT